jgi:hypothetical protein
MALKLTTSLLEDTTALFRYYKGLAERAMAQVGDEQLFRAPDEESNSIAVNVKHMAGNLRSRWTDFLATDGEKPDRNRDAEFVASPATREDLLENWEAAWSVLFGTLSTLTDADLARSVTIRGEPHSVLQAVNRALSHAAYHVGHIVCLSKQFAHAGWQPLTIPRNRSAEYNRAVASGEKSQR